MDRAQHTRTLPETLVQLSLRDLEHLCSEFGRAIDQGLRTNGQSVAALPAFVAPAASDLSGRALVIDTGGTNMRATVVRFEDGQGEVEQAPIKRELPAAAKTSMAADDFFDAQAELTKELENIDGLPVGYCFSYPSESRVGGDAKLVRWTKGLDVHDVVGRPVGSALLAALARRGVANPSVVVVNDTVATLVAASAHPTSPNPAHSIGLIVGTGTNMAAYYNAGGAPKLDHFGWPGLMAVNLESGNFTPPGLTPADDAADAISDRPGVQRFEKAVSGQYLPYVFAAMCPDLPDFDPAMGSETLVNFDRATEAGQIAQQILDRSADLVAAGLVAVGKHWPVIEVLAEGSLFWKVPGYKRRVENRAEELLAPGRTLRVHKLKHANLLGAAAAALSGAAG